MRFSIADFNLSQGNEYAGLQSSILRRIQKWTHPHITSH